MVVALGPGKFYGSSLPRPRIYTDMKLNDERVDPPVSVLDPLLSWAEEAHWSMGGLSFKRHRLQGRIEGSIKKLRAERESFIKKRNQSASAVDRIRSSGKGSTQKNVTPSPPPAPIVNKRRRLMALIDEDEDEDSEADQESKGKHVGVGVRRRSARKLGDDFDRVAVESGLGKSRGSPAKNSGGGLSETVATRTRSRRSEKDDGDCTDRVKMVKEVNKPKSKVKKLEGNGKAKRGGENGGFTSPSGTRTSPRLLKRELL